MDLLWFLRDTRYCLLQIFSDTVCAFCTIAGVFLLSEKFGGFGGMNQGEILFMMGFSTLVDGIYMMFFIGNNTSMISRIIGRGQLDHVMIQPVPLWAELLAQGFSPLSGSSMLVCGIGLTAYAVRRLPYPPHCPGCFCCLSMRSAPPYWSYPLCSSCPAQHFTHLRQPRRSPRQAGIYLLL